jgi:hypothetical protein
MLASVKTNEMRNKIRGEHETSVKRRFEAPVRDEHVNDNLFSDTAKLIGIKD